LVQAHGGQLGVVSDKGQGTTFWFTIPVASSAV
jgi:signal transduction histidine kinase